MYPNTFLPGRLTHETVELRELVQSGVNIWDFEYPSYYKGEQKTAFEKKVLDHFWTRQIGQETVGRFLLYFRRTVREIMPLYIQRYESVDLMKNSEIRPLDNYNMIEEYEGENTDSGSVSGSSQGTDSMSGETGGASVRHDTPQNQLNIPLTPDGNMTLTHASEAEQTRGLNTSEASRTDQTSSESSSAGTSKHTLTRRGNIGVTTYAQLLEGYRQTFLNIDMEVINELESCFLGVY